MGTRWGPCITDALYETVAVCLQLDDEREKQRDAELLAELELDELDEAFLREYQARRLHELRKAYDSTYVCPGEA